MLSEYLNQRLSFDTAAPGILGSSRSGARLVAVLDYSTASAFADVQAKHAQVKNVVPDIPAQAGKYLYGKFTYPDGSSEILGEPWIVASSIRAVVTRTLLITIDQNVTEETEALARAALTQNGITGFTIDSSF
jgi:hypothetical protein